MLSVLSLRYANKSFSTPTVVHVLLIVMIDLGMVPDVKVHVVMDVGYLTGNLNG